MRTEREQGPSRPVGAARDRSGEKIVWHADRMSELDLDAPLSRTAASAAVADIGWRFLLGDLAVSVPVRSLAQGSAVVAAVNGGFFSVADDRISVLAREAQLGGDVDTSAARAALDEALQNAEASAEGDEESSDVRYYRALLRAAGEPADGA